MDICKRCVLPDTYDEIKFDNKGVCHYCNSEHSEETIINSDKNITESELKEYLNKFKNMKGKYDVLVPVSGGVDSSVVLIDLVEKYNLRPLAFHNDHGYEDEIATDNVKKLCKSLNVDLIIWQHDLEFMKKLWKYTNESNIKKLNACYLCGNILYLNGLELASNFNIPLIVNGYSKGQVEIINNQEEGNRLLQEVIDAFTEVGDKEFLNSFIEKYNIISKQRIIRDASDFRKEIDSNKIVFIPYYMFKFNKTDKEVLTDVCKEKFDWQPMNTTYPARTTNCSMIWLNTYFDLKKMNYSVYTEEYATLIRKGEITREQALKDLEFNPPEGMLERLSSDIEISLDFNYNDIRNKESLRKEIEEVDFNF